MGFFEELASYIKVATDNVGKKATQIKDYSKLKYSESGIKAEIAKKKQALGGYIYDCSKNGEIDKEVMQSFVEAIDELEENLQITREMLAVAKNKITCDSCKAENERGSNYCCKCGAKIVEKEPVAEETPVQEVKVDEAVVENVTVAEKEEAKVEDVTVAEKEEAKVEDVTVAEKEEAKVDEPVVEVTAETTPETTEE